MQTSLAIIYKLPGKSAFFDNSLEVKLVSRMRYNIEEIT